MTSEVPTLPVELLAEEYAAARRNRDQLQQRIDTTWAVESARAALTQAQQELDTALSTFHADVEHADHLVNEAKQRLLHAWPAGSKKTLTLQNGGSVQRRDTTTAHVPQAHQDALCAWILRRGIGRDAIILKWASKPLLSLRELAPEVSDLIQLETTSTLALKEDPA